MGYVVDSLTVGVVAMCRLKFASEIRDALASLYPTAEGAPHYLRLVHATTKVLNQSAGASLVPA